MIAIIINPVSGGATLAVARKRAESAARHLDRLGLAGEVYVTERRGHARALADTARRRGDTRVIAWGGDGTVNEIGSALVGTDTVLGIVPAGSGNGLARELLVPRSSEAALALAMTAEARPIDAGTIDGRWFFSIAGIGFDAHVAAAFDRDGGRRGLVGYVRMTARELLRYRCEVYRIDGGPPQRALLVTLANTTQFGNGARIAPTAALDDGLLDLVVFEEQSRVATIFGLPRLFTGGVERTRGVTIRKVVSATIACEVPMPFHVDGEPVAGGTRLEVRVHPGVLNVAAASRAPRTRTRPGQAGA